MIALTIAMLAVVGAWAALGALLIGLGMLVLAWARPTPWPERLFPCFWLGYLAALAVLQVWHLFAPVGSATLIALAALSLVGMRLRGAGLLAVLRRSVRDRWGWWAGGALVTLWLANRALGPPVGDSGVYHLTAVRWATSWAIVPGLANLEPRLGFNNASLLWAALLEIGPGHGRSAHLANGVLVLALALRGLAGLSRVWREPRDARPVDLFAALLLPVAVSHGVTLFEMRVSALDPDAAAALVMLTAAGHVVRLLTEPRRGVGDVAVDLFAATSLATLAWCIKVSQGAFAAGLIVVAVLAAARRVGRAELRTPLAAWGLAATILLVPWLVRAVVLSGYPLFPLTVLGVDVDWRIPSERAGKAAQDIRTHFVPPIVRQMRGPGEGWVRPWLVWQITRLPELVILPAVLLVSALALRLRARAAPAPILWLLSPCALAGLAWGATAPHPRFAYGFFWTAAAACVTAAMFADASRRGSSRRAVLLLLLVGLAVFPAVHRVVAWAWFGDLERAAQSIVLGPGPDHGFFPTPVSRLRTERSETGLAVNMPESGDQIWDAPLPATTELPRGLALRNPARLGDGFRAR